MDVERPRSALENLNRVSLLDIVQQKTASLNRKSLIDIAIFVGKLNPERRLLQELTETTEQLIKSYAGHLQVEPVSGLLLIYPNYFVHVLEGPSSILEEIIYEISHDRFYVDVISEIKLLIYSSDISQRLFGQWASRILNVSSVRLDESKMQDSTEVKVSEALKYIVKLSCELAKIPKLQLKASLDQLSTKFSHLLIPQDVIETLLKDKFIPTLVDVAEKRRKHVSVLEGELTWPLEENLLFSC